MLRYRKCDLIHNLVNTNNTDSEKLYKIVTEITGQNKQNQQPESTSEQQVAKDFAAFFSLKYRTYQKSSKEHIHIHQNPMTHHIWIDSQHSLMKKSTNPYLECYQNHVNLTPSLQHS